MGIKPHRRRQHCSGAAVVTHVCPQLPALGLFVAQAGFHLCDATGYLAEVHLTVPAAGLFRVHVRFAFPAGQGPALPVRQEDIDVVGKLAVHAGYSTRRIHPVTTVATEDKNMAGH